MNLLILDYNAERAERIKADMVAEKHTCAIGGWLDMMEWVASYDWDLILLGTMPFGAPVAGAIRELRMAGHKTPVIVIGVATADKEAYVADCVACLGAGADDYVGLPMRPAVLLARIVAVVKRSMNLAEPLIKVGELVYDINRNVISCDSGVLPLTPNEHAVLAKLMMKKDAGAISLARLYDDLYGGMEDADIKIIRVFICKIRAKLKQAGVKDGRVVCLWGRGYQVRGGKDERC